MSKQQWRVVLWIGFTALWFAVWFGVKYLLNGTIDVIEALIFFVIFGLIDKGGVDWIVDRYMKDHEDRFGK